MQKQPDPQKAIHLKPHQRTLRRGQRRQVPPGSQWEPHRSDAALDEWGVALRALREQGHQFGQE